MESYLKVLTRTYLLYLLSGLAFLPTAFLYALDSAGSHSPRTAVAEIIVGLLFAHAAWTLSTGLWSTERLGTKSRNVALVLLAAGGVGFVVLLGQRIPSSPTQSLPEDTNLVVQAWRTMGPVAKGVAWILFFMLMWTIGVATERIYALMRAKDQSRAYAPEVAKHIRDGDINEAIAVSISENYRYSHLAKVVLAGLREYQFQQESGNRNREQLVDAVRRAIQRATAQTGKDMKKGVGSLATVGATAPFVGLIGTVVGIVNAFAGIAATGSGGIAAVSAGIAEALVETALGLIVAIPAVWAYNYLTGRIEYFSVEADQSSSAILSSVTSRATAR